MKSLIVYTVDQSGGPCWKRAEPLAIAKLYIDLQVVNSLRVGWRADDILCVTNFDHSAFGVKCHNIGDEYFKGFVGGCMAKHLGAQWALEKFGDSIYLRDHDCYQLTPFNCAAILHRSHFVVSGGKGVKISDQSCFMSREWLPSLRRFISEHSREPKDSGFGFKLGSFIQSVQGARVEPYAQFPYRFNLVSPRWRKELEAMSAPPMAVHQKLGIPDMAEFLGRAGHWEFLRLYAAYSAAANRLAVTVAQPPPKADNPP